MAIAKRQVFINAPLKDVYDWVEWSPNFVQVWPNLIKSVHYEQDENGMGRHETIYMMAGIQFQVTARDIEKIPNKKIVAKSVSGINTILTWEFEEAEGGTNVTLTAEYEAPGQAVRQLTLGLIKRLNEADLTKLMENIKEVLEEKTAAA